MMRLLMRHYIGRLAAVSLFFVAPVLFAQSTQSTILGTVTDPSGAVVPGVQIRITNTDQGTTVSSVSNRAGAFQATSLLPGKYTVQASREGFETKLVEDLQLSARQQLRVDVSLALGSAHQEVTVDASSVGAIETETPSISATLNTQSVMSLPANFRASGSTSPLNLIQTLPGVQPDTGPGTTTPTANGAPTINFSVQGGQPFQTETSVDGISTQSMRNNTPLSDAFPSAESVSEIRVDGVDNNAEFGQAGEVTTVTKSGTNQFHGSLFWYHQNRALDAVAYGTAVNADGQPEKPQKIGNDFGASVGGPLILPHLYDGHDRTFFFGTYEGFRFPRQSTIQDLVPTQLMQEGNFSEEVPDGPLYDAFTGGAYTNNIVSPINASANPFLKFFPLPNVGNYQTVEAAEAGPGYNYAANRDSGYNSNQGDARIDHRFGNRLQAFARYTYKDITLLDPQDLNISSVTDFDNYRILASSFVYTITPNLVDEFRFGFTYERNGLKNALDGAPYTNAAGFDSVGTNYPVDGMTEIYFPNLTTLAAGNINQTSRSHLFQYTDNLTWSKGTHTVKFGADIRALESLTTLGTADLNNVSVFIFTGNFAGALLGNNYPTAQYADFLSGVPAETQYYGLTPQNDGKSVYYAGYVQDQWKASPTLTLSYGIRYEYHPAYHDVDGAIGNFDPSNPQTGAVIYPDGHQNLLDSTFLASFDACGYGPSTTSYAACTPVLSNSQAHLPNSLRKSVKDRLLPRFGFAWRPFNDDKTAVRGGFGVYNTTLLGSIFFSMTDTLQAATLVYQNGINSSGALDYAWPQTSPVSSTNTPDYGTASFGTANEINWKDPYSMQWNLSVDHEFKGDIGTRISYIAMKTDDLVWAPNLNDMSYSKTTPAEERPLTDRPFPNWGEVNDRQTGAQATYESLQMEANHRFVHGFTFDSTYTWAKNLADNQGPVSTGFAAENGSNVGGVSTYLYDRGLDFGNVYGTRRHRWVTTGVYELPFGHNKQFGAHMNKAEDAVFGGWQLSSIFLWQTGPYLTAYIPSTDADPSGTGSGILYGRDQHPDVIGKIRPVHRNRNEWVNPQSFACPSDSGYTATSYAGNACGVGVTSNPIGRFGNESVGDIEGPGSVNWSAGLSKRVALTDKVSLRAETTFTNVLNHTNLNDPELDITNANFGKITSSRGSDFGGNRTGQVSMRLEF
ncbi:carboxypeptidase regulatory-like domain-containing protein [Silvibacterium sp.]|uniref:TonB-dependent receptor n=1 Tax=Silvibacterium sp. TaxID=1964179 RepID=UPI0039E31ECC